MGENHLESRRVWAADRATKMTNHLTTSVLVGLNPRLNYCMISQKNQQDPVRIGRHKFRTKTDCRFHPECEQGRGINWLQSKPMSAVDCGRCSRKQTFLQTYSQPMLPHTNRTKLWSYISCVAFWGEAGVCGLEVTTLKKTAAERVPSECSQPRYIGDIFQNAVNFQNLHCGDACSVHDNILRFEFVWVK